MKALEIKPSASVFVYTTAINMRYSFDSLEDLIKRYLKKDPGCGDVYLFCNKKRNYIKLFYWHKGGWCIFSKRIDHGKFDVSERDTLSWEELKTLVNLVHSHSKKLLKAA